METDYNHLVIEPITLPDSLYNTTKMRQGIFILDEGLAWTILGIKESKDFSNLESLLSPLFEGRLSKPSNGRISPKM